MPCTDDRRLRRIPLPGADQGEIRPVLPCRPSPVPDAVEPSPGARPGLDWDSVRWCSDNCRKHGPAMSTGSSRPWSRCWTGGQPAPGVSVRGGACRRRGRLVRADGAGADGRSTPAATGSAEITQGGQVIDPSRFRGPDHAQATMSVTAGAARQGTMLPTPLMGDLGAASPRPPRA